MTIDEEESKRLGETEVVKGEKLTQEGNTFKGLSSTVQIYAHIKNLYKKCSVTLNMPVRIITYWRSDSRMRRAAFTMDIATMVNTGLADKGTLNAAVIVYRRLGKHLGPRRF